MKKHTITFVFMLCVLLAKAQDFTGLNFKLSNNAIVETGVKDGVFVFAHSYQLMDTATMQRFGRYGNKEFGKTMTIAVKIKNGYIVSEAAVAPWEYDDNYAKYKGLYKPVSYKIESRQIADTIGVEMYDGIMPNHKILQGTNINYVEDSISFGGEGFDIDNEYGIKNGWCVWYTTTSNANCVDSLTTISTMTNKHDMTVEIEKKRYSIDAPNTEATVLGGIYVIPVQQSVGLVNFKLSGIMVKEGEKWNIITPFVEFNASEELSPVEISKNQVNEEETNIETGNKKGRKSSRKQ